MRFDRWMCLSMLGAVLVLGSGCKSNRDDASADGAAGSGFFGSRVTVPSGTVLDVQLGSSLSSETARAGQTWTGTLTSPVVVEGREVVPAGSTVEGTVVSVQPARRGSRARLELGVRAVRVDDRKTSLHARAEPVIAGSTRARNLGAIAGGAAAGALLGKAIGGDGDDAAKGAIVGGAVATGAVAASKGYQVELRDGTTMSFVVTDDVAVAVQ